MNYVHKIYLVTMSMVTKIELPQEGLQGQFQKKSPCTINFQKQSFIHTPHVYLLS